MASKRSEKSAKKSPRAPRGIGDPGKATGISNRPRGEEAEEQKHVHPRGQALGDPDETGERADRDGDGERRAR
jgi:hypothetical protein